MVPLAKKGDLSQMTNYRGKTLVSIATKLYNRLLLNRIRDAVDSHLRPNQAGFRSGRSCVEQIEADTYYPSITRRSFLPTAFVVTFIDFFKAFDSISRPKMFAILRNFSIPKKIVDAIGTLYPDSKSAVIVDGHVSDFFDVKAGVLRGDVLAPFLFITAIDWIMRHTDDVNVKEKSRSEGSRL